MTLLLFMINEYNNSKLNTEYKSRKIDINEIRDASNDIINKNDFSSFIKLTNCLYIKKNKDETKESEIKCYFQLILYLHILLDNFDSYISNKKKIFT